MDDAPVILGVQAGVNQFTRTVGYPRGTGAHRIIGRPVPQYNQILNSLSIRQAHHNCWYAWIPVSAPLRARTGCAWRGQ